jgi:hypothetical protein
VRVIAIKLDAVQERALAKFIGFCSAIISTGFLRTKVR